CVPWTFGGADNAMGKVAVVIDNGSCFTRAGFAGEDKPKSVLKTTSMPLTAPAVMSGDPIPALCIPAQITTSHPPLDCATPQ
uniref:Actin n=1 Tax=Chrysemys picta bellii TaxID=8478 RepID=A0A8C3I1S7_CHRPI